MKKALLLLLLASSSLFSNAQDWVEVGVDTQHGPMFLVNDIEYIGDSTVLLAGYSHDYNSQAANKIRGGYLKSIDGGRNWDTSYYFNSGFFVGENYRIAQYDTSVYLIKGIASNTSNPTQNPYQPYASGYELNMYNKELELTKSLLSNLVLDYFLEEVVPISHNTLGLVMSTEPSSGLWLQFFARFDINTLTWDSIPLPVYVEYINDIHFVDSSLGYMACGSIYDEQSGYVLVTQDGGRTWSVWTDNSSSMYQCIEFYNRNDGITSSGQGLMYYTHNAGFDWHQAIGIPTRFRAYDICRADANHAYAIGIYSFLEDGNSQSYTQIYRSSNKGQSWCLVYEDTTFNNKREMQIAFSNANHGVAAYGYNKLIYTENGGGLTECATGIAETKNSHSITIYPNPNQGSFTIEMPTSEVFEMEVSDLSGKVVARKQSVGSALQMDGLENGMYIVRLYSQQRTYIQKVVVTQ